MREFAEQEIVLEDGPFPGRFRSDRQPFARLFFDAVDSGLWQLVNALGSVQSGKTLIAFIVPVLFHLFELRETVLCGVPDMQLAADKWNKILLPAIRRTRYSSFLPSVGEGSREASKIASVGFGNSATLRFMAGGGGDAARSSYTARVLAITETDKLDLSSTTSREADKVTQLIARTKSFDDEARVYMECTASIESGRTWQNHLSGSTGKIALPCPSCDEWVIPTDTIADRDLLQGWKEAQDEIEAAEKGHFACPHCGSAWTEAERREANCRAELIHRGQTIREVAVLDGATADVRPIKGTKFAVVGPLPRTRMLSFRWSAINNGLRTAGNMAAEEFAAARAIDEDNAQKAVHQFLWALPFQGDVTPLTSIDCAAIQRRTRKLTRGMVPDDTLVLTVGIDMGKYRGYFVVEALTPHGTHVVEYDILDIETQRVGLDHATLKALYEFSEVCRTGWPKQSGGTLPASQVWIDTGWADSAPTIKQFCHEMRAQLGIDVFMPLIGRGEGVEARRRYDKPNRSGNLIHRVGEEYHITWFKNDQCYVVDVNVDYWKGVVHDRLGLPVGPDGPAKGAMTLFEAPPVQHLAFGKHLTSEVRVQEFVAGKGVVTRWERRHRNNHYFDATVYGAAAGNFALREKEAHAAKRDDGDGMVYSGLETPDGRAFLAGQAD